MSDYYSDYYESQIITGNKRGIKKDLDLKRINQYIKLGLSSVKIAKIFKVSYPTILRNVDRYLSAMSDKLRENGRKNMIRRASDKAS